MAGYIYIKTSSKQAKYIKTSSLKNLNFDS